MLLFFRIMKAPVTQKNSRLKSLLVTHSNLFRGGYFFFAAGASQNSGECPVDTLLFHWENDKLPSQEEVMEIFHFNTNLQLDVRYERSEKNFAEENELDRVFKCRRQLPSESSFYETLPKVLDGYVRWSTYFQFNSIYFILDLSQACKTGKMFEFIVVFGLKTERKES